MLRRPVEDGFTVPPVVELLAANLTLVTHDKGSRCYANSVIRMWCWMGAHHDRPEEFWGVSSKTTLRTCSGLRSCNQPLPGWGEPTRAT